MVVDFSHESFAEDEWEYQRERWHERFLGEETTVEWAEVYYSIAPVVPHHGDCPF